MPKDYSKSILVVGNGPSILDKPLGKIIDSFGTVVRLNRFFLTPPEAVPVYCGLKTDVWATKRLYESEIDDENLKEIIFLLINHKETEYQKNALKKKCERAGAKFTVYPETLLEQNNVKMREFVKNNEQEVLKYTKGHGKVVPSTGLNVIAYYLQRVPYVYVHGFDLMKAGLIHYWDDDTWDNWTHVSKANVYPAEKWMFNQFLSAGKIRRLVDK